MYKAIRYIGSKQKVLPFLEENLFSLLKEGDSFFDGFVGSGVVSQYIAEKNPSFTITGGDISKYSEILFDILNIGYDFNEQEIKDIFTEFEKQPLIDGDIFNEFSANGVPTSYSEPRNFYHEKSGKTIDTFKKFLKDKILSKVINENQAKVLSFFLLAYACKVANTTSVFGAFLKSPPVFKPFDLAFAEKILKELSVLLSYQKQYDFYLGDIVSNLKVIPNHTVIYLDPPYSTRRYESNYHILSFIADLNFTSSELKQGSKTGQPNFLASNPFGKKKDTETVFSEMIIEGVKKSDHLGISYNTDGIITEEWMQDFCNKHNLNLETKKLTYKRFKSKNEVKNTEKLEEILWIIRK